MPWAVVKHYALNSMENARFTVDVTADDAALHEVYLAHFRRVVDEGVLGVMTAYNSVNGEWAGQNEQLMEEVLRREWGFRGVTVSDFIWGLRDAGKSLRAGLDVEEPFQQQRREHLRADLAEGRASWGRRRPRRPPAASCAPRSTTTPPGPRPSRRPASSSALSTGPSPGPWPPAAWCCSRTTVRCCRCGVTRSPRSRSSAGSPTSPTPATTARPTSAPPRWSRRCRG